MMLEPTTQADGDLITVRVDMRKSLTYTAHAGHDPTPGIIVQHHFGNFLADSQDSGERKGSLETRKEGMGWDGIG